MGIGDSEICTRIEGVNFHPPVMEKADYALSASSSGGARMAMKVVKGKDENGDENEVQRVEAGVLTTPGQ